MKKSLLSLALAVIMVMALFTINAFAEGKTVVGISSVEDLQEITGDGSYVLLSNIDASQLATIDSFSGTLDGNGYAIMGLTQPLFGKLDGAVIDDLELAEVNITGTGVLSSGASDIKVGALAKEASGSSISNVNVSGTINMSFNENSLVGGVCGFSSNSAMRNCSFNGDITVVTTDSKTSYVGGIAAYTWIQDGTGVFSRCTSSGSIASTGAHDTFLGGISGLFVSVGWDAGSINGCSTYMTMTGTAANKMKAGGMCGYADHQAEIYECSSSAKINVSADEDCLAGGIVAYGEKNLKVYNCYVVDASIAAKVTSAGKASYAGGICAYTWAGNAAIYVDNCITMNSTVSADHAGSIAGMAEQNSIYHNCFFEGASTENGIASTGGSYNVTESVEPKTEEALLDPNTYSTWDNFNEVWNVSSSGISLRIEDANIPAKTLVVASEAGTDGTTFTSGIYTGTVGVDVFKSISDAVEEANDGYEIIVAPGTYNEIVTFDGKSLTLKGANAGVNPNTETRGEESVITGTFSTSREKLSTEAVAGQTIIIDGFKFTGNGLKVGDCSYNTVEYLTVQNCIMEAGTNLDASTLVNTYGSNIYNYFVKVTNGSGARATVTIQNNLITGKFDNIDANNGVYPIQLWYVKDATVTGNVIALTNTDDIHQAINISKLAADAEVIVKDNVISGAAGGIYVTTWTCGGDTTGKTDFEGTIDIINNTLTGAGTGNFEPIFVGYEAEGHGAFNGTLNEDNNTNNGAPVAVEVGQKPGSTGYFTVTVVSGNSVVDTKTVESGTEYTLPTPTKAGYIFLGWRSGDATYKAGENVAITADTTFTAVWGNLPDVKPSEPDTPDTPLFPFHDVTARDWFYDAVKYVYEKGLMDGVDVGVFAPNDTLTRAMVWTIIARAEGVDTTGGATWYAKAQEWVTAKGISDGENPNAAITRQELVTMLYRLAGEPAVSGTITAPDAASVSTWAQSAMTWAMNIGLVEGDENGAVTPTATATRAQAAALIMRYLEA